MAQYKDIEVLLDLNGESFHDESGFWWKIKATKVKPNAHIPHGIRYELTLHNKQNQRIMGFDNAHAPTLDKYSKKLGKYKGTITEWDHQHKTLKDKGSAYQYESAHQLLSDFFDKVNQIITEHQEEK